MPLILQITMSRDELRTGAIPKIKVIGKTNQDRRAEEQMLEATVELLDAISSLQEQ